MKLVNFVIIFILFSFPLFSQSSNLIPTMQFMHGILGVEDDEVVTHYIHAIGSVWELSNGNFVISSNPIVYEDSLVTIGNADTTSEDWPGFNFVWLNDPPYWGLGFYKVFNSKQPDKYFYLDARDSDFGGAVYNPDFKVLFDNSEGIFHHMELASEYPGIEMENGSVVRIWDIKGETANTSGLQNYWSHVLVCIEASSHHPKIVWGPYTSFAPTHYKVYRAVSKTPINPRFLNFSLIATTDANTYEYTDREFVIGGGMKFYAYYYVKAYKSSNNSYSSASNTITVTGDFTPFKPDIVGESELLTDFQLQQNYPNPFNPTTTITYVLPNGGDTNIASQINVKLTIYDALGRKVATLVNSKQDPGNYSVKFNASKLGSGVYFYTLRCGNFVQTRKMILMK